MIEDRHGTTFQTTLAAILSTPETVLAQYSNISDRNQGLRQLTLIGLLCGLPLFIYGALFSAGFGVFETMAAIWFRCGRCDSSFNALPAVPSGVRCGYRVDCADQTI